MLITWHIFKCLYIILHIFSMYLYNEAGYLISVVSLFVTGYYEDDNESTFLKFQMIPEA